MNSSAHSRNYLYARETKILAVEEFSQLKFELQFSPALAIGVLTSQIT